VVLIDEEVARIDAVWGRGGAGGRPCWVVGAREVLEVATSLTVLGSPESHSTSEGRVGAADEVVEGGEVSGVESITLLDSSVSVSFFSSNSGSYIVDNWPISEGGIDAWGEVVAFGEPSCPNILESGSSAHKLGIAMLLFSSFSSFFLSFSIMNIYTVGYVTNACRSNGVQRWSRNIYLVLFESQTDNRYLCFMRRSGLI
jgi:hypothetical protein